MSTETTGAIATAMAAATAKAAAENAAKIAADAKAEKEAAERAAKNATAFPFAILGYRVEPKPSEWAPKSGAYTKKRTGYVLVSVGAFAFPAEVSVIFPAKKGKPTVSATLPTIRYQGAMFTPRSTDKKQQDKDAARLTAFETLMSAGFVKWYRAQDNLPPLTSRVTSGGLSGVEIDDADDDA